MKIRLATLSLILIATSIFISRASRPEVVPVRQSLSDLPMQLGEWKGQDSPEMDPRVREVLGVDDFVDRIYYSPELFPLNLYIGYYQSQREGDTIHSPLNCMPGAGWNLLMKSHITIPANGNGSIEINRIIIQKGMDRQLVLYWYQSHGRVVASEYLGKIYTVLDALRTNRTDGSLVRVICPVLGKGFKSEAVSEQNALDFAKRLFPQLLKLLPH